MRYFEHLEYLVGEKKELTAEDNANALKRFATVPLEEGDVEKLERELAN